MAFESTSTIQKNKTFAPIILGIAILLAFFWIFPTFSKYNDNSASLSNIESNLANKQAEFDKLKKIEADVQSENSPNSAFIKKISQDFVSTDILSAIMINNYTQPKLWVQAGAPIMITNISLDRWSALPIGIYQGKINMTITSNSVDSIVEYLSYLTNNTNFAFTINDITLPIDTLEITEAKTISLPISLGLYYYP